MKQPWSDLPNAHHIDWVLNSLKENPKLWHEALDAASDTARNKAWDATQAIEAAVAAAAWGSGATRAAAPRHWADGRARAAANSAILALVVYDDCDQYLALGYEKLKVYAALSDKPQAVLLLSMMHVREKLNESVSI